MSQAQPVAAGDWHHACDRYAAVRTLSQLFPQELEETGMVPVTEGEEEPEAEDPEEFKRRWDLIIARYEATHQKKKDRKVGTGQADARSQLFAASPVHLVVTTQGWL